MSTETTAPVGGEITTKAKLDFNQIARQVMPVAEALVNATFVRPGQRLLDVACGSGNAALIAARRYANVSGIDYVPALIESARARAAAEGSDVEFRVGDAQALAFPDQTFDTVLSVFGAMFAPDQEKTAAELLRVCKPGGTIGMANWMPREFGGDFFGVHAKRTPPPAGLKPGTRWGTEQGLTELLGAGCAAIQAEPKTVTMYFRSIDHAIQTFREYFGPTSRAFSAVGPEGEQALYDDLHAVFSRYNRGTDGTAAIECAYMQVLAIRSM